MNKRVEVPPGVKENKMMKCNKYILITALCELVGSLIGMALGLGLVVLIYKMGWMEKFL